MTDHGDVVSWRFIEWSQHKPRVECAQCERTALVWLTIRVTRPIDGCNCQGQEWFNNICGGCLTPRRCREQNRCLAPMPRRRKDVDEPRCVDHCENVVPDVEES